MDGNQAERFGMWLNLTMENRGIRGRDLARKLDVTDSAVSRWRSGQGVPTMDTCLRLAKLLNVPPLRLAVTAGLLDGELAESHTLPMPEPTARRKRVQRQLAAIKGLTVQERQHLLNAYDDKVQEENDRRTK